MDAFAGSSRGVVAGRFDDGEDVHAVAGPHVSPGSDHLVHLDRHGPHARRDDVGETLPNRVGRQLARDNLLPCVDGSARHLADRRFERCEGPAQRVLGVDVGKTHHAGRDHRAGGDIPRCDDDCDCPGSAGLPRLAFGVRLECEVHEDAGRRRQDGGKQKSGAAAPAKRKGSCLCHVPSSGRAGGAVTR